MDITDPPPPARGDLVVFSPPGEYTEGARATLLSRARGDESRYVDVPLGSTVLVLGPPEPMRPAGRELRGEGVQSVLVSDVLIGGVPFRVRTGWLRSAAPGGSE
jgi:hypothetical protein